MTESPAKTAKSAANVESTPSGAETASTSDRHLAGPWTPMASASMPAPHSGPGQAEPVQPSAGLVEQVREEPRMVGKVLVLRPGAQGGRGGTVRGRGDVGDEGLDVGQVAGLVSGHAHSAFVGGVSAFPVFGEGGIQIVGDSGADVRIRLVPSAAHISFRVTDVGASAEETAQPLLPLSRVLAVCEEGKLRPSWFSSMSVSSNRPNRTMPVCLSVA